MSVQVVFEPGDTADGWIVVEARLFVAMVEAIALAKGTHLRVVMGPPSPGASITGPVYEPVVTELGAAPAQAVQRA